MINTQRCIKSTQNNFIIRNDIKYSLICIKNVRDLDLVCDSCYKIIMFQSAGKKTLCDIMHRHLHIFQGVKSFWRFTYLCEQTPYHSHTARHHFSFLWYFSSSGVELWKVIIFSSYFYSAFELFGTDVLSTPNPGQTIYLNLAAIFLCFENHQKTSRISSRWTCVSRLSVQDGNLRQ